MRVAPLPKEYDLPALRAVICGVSAVPQVLSSAWRDAIGVPIARACGMAEMSPRAAWRRCAPRSLPASSWRETARPAATSRWRVRQYYKTDDEPADSFSPDGWLHTGDVFANTPLSYLRIVDRTTDLVKSGGAWISSVDLENQITGHPAVKEAAVIAMPQ